MQRVGFVLLAALVAAPLMALPAAGQPIVGNWRTASGETARIAKCGAAFCITLPTGKFKGRRIGQFTKSGAEYNGTITDPKKDKTYTGSAMVAGRSMSLSGCVMGIFCRSQTWKKR